VPSFGDQRSTRLTSVLLLAIAGALAACATIDATTTQYVGAPRVPASDPAKVQILRVEPTRPHDRLGEILLEASTEPAPPITELEDRLRAETAKLGADAALVVEDRVGPIGMYGGAWWGGGVYLGRRLIAVAIKYR
jgi:hypothetical protein